MDSDQETAMVILVATGVAVVNGPTALQVLWLIGVGLAAVFGWARRRALAGPAGGGPGSRPPMGTI